MAHLETKDKDMNDVIRRTRVYVMLVLLVCGASVTANAQDLQRQLGTDVPVTFVLADELDYPDTDAVVLRRTDRQPHDVVVFMRSNINPNTIAAATAVLVQTRRVYGDQPNANRVVRVLGHRVPPEWRRRLMPAASRVLRELLSQERVSIPGFNDVQVLEVWLRSSESGGSRR